MKIEDLRINQKVQLITSMPDWHDVNIVTIVGLSIGPTGKENVTIDDGSGYQYDGWLAGNFLPLEPEFPKNRVFDGAGIV